MRLSRQEREARMRADSRNCYAREQERYFVARHFSGRSPLRVRRARVAEKRKELGLA